MSDDRWKDELLERPYISLAEFNTLPSEKSTWILQYKHIFYQLNGADFKNLLHKDNHMLNKLLKITAQGIKDNPKTYKRLSKDESKGKN